MSKIDFYEQRKKLDREITYFHFHNAKKIVSKCIQAAYGQDDDFFICYFVAQRYILCADFEQAVIWLDKALSINENDGCSYNDKAICFAEQKRYIEALGCFNKGIRKDDSCASLFHNKGWLLNVLEKYKESVICFSKALEIDSNRPETVFSLADSYERLDNYDKAFFYYCRAQSMVKGKSRYMSKFISERIKEIKELIDLKHSYFIS